MAATNEALIAKLAAEFGRLETIPLSAATRLIVTLEGAGDEALKLIAERRVKFCWTIARRILRDRGVKV